MTDKKRIFISHATKDDALVDTIAEKLDPHTDLWIDHKKGLSPSDPDWEYALRVAIQSCDAGVFIMTKNALHSKVCKSECLLVQNLGKPLYVIRAEAVEFKEIWLTISLIQYADWVRDADKAITDLTRAINGESGADIPTPARKFTDAGQIHQNLPYLSNPLRGRETDVAWIQDNLGDGVTQIIATGGMGKSRLCAEIALNYADGAVWYRCDLSKTHSDLQIALREHADLPEGTPFATTQALIIQRKPLVVVDNAESVPDHERKNYVTLLSALAGGGVPILLTSRTTWREFKPRTEHNLTLLDPVNAFEMTRDFVRTEKLVNKMPLTPDKLRDIASAGRYYPRLIEFAIGQLHEFKYEVIIKRLRNLTHEDVRGALDEMITQTVAQMATENHGADAERLLRRLTWLTATVPEAVIVALMPDDMDEDRLADALALLRRYQFVRYEDATDRYAVAVLMREALGTDPTAFDIYADFYTRRAKEIFVDLEDSPELWADGEGGANFDDVVNIKALGVELMHQTDNGTVGDLARALEFAVMTRRYVTNRMEAGAWDWLEMGLNAVRALRKDAPDDADWLGGEASMLNDLGLIKHYLGYPHDALRYYEEALRLRLQGGNQREEATTLNNIGLVYSTLRDKQKALMYYEQALPIRRAVGDRGGEATTLNNIANVYYALGDTDKALAYFEQAIPLFRAVGNRGGEAATLNNIGAVYRALGDKHKALEYYEQALPIRRVVGDRGGEATTLNNIGMVYDALGEKQKALAYFEQALPISEGIGDVYSAFAVAGNIGVTYNELNDLDKAIAYLEKAVAIGTKINHPDLQACQNYLMNVKRQRGDADVPPEEPNDLMRQLMDLLNQIRNTNTDADDNDDGV